MVLRCSVFKQLSRNAAKYQLQRCLFSSKEIEVTDKANGVFHLQLNRPEHRNSFTLDLWKDLNIIFDELSENSKCRSIVLSGSGKSFCSGIDLKSGLTGLLEIAKNEEMDTARKARAMRKMIRICQDSFASAEKCNKPVIAAIHSHCYGAGISLASCCDVRYCSKDTIFSIKEVDIGIAADVGILQRMEGIVGNASWAREVAFTARDFSATEALNNDHQDCVHTALSLAEHIAKKSPIAVQGSKLAMNYARNHGVDSSMEWILTWNQSQLQSEDLIRSATAKMTKTEPKFDDVKFKLKTVIISGASRGIGKEIALKLAKDGANIVICAKTTTAHAKLPGTIYTAAEEVEKAGGQALPCMVDIREEQSVSEAVEAAVKKFGGIDILINNASAISLTGTMETPMKRYDLMNGVNARGTFMISQKCIPYLKQAKNAHILNISPPLVMESQWFAHHVAYTMAKYGMSMCVLGMHEELRPMNIAVNALWPKTGIWTSAMEMMIGEHNKEACRKPSIVADAAYVMLSKNSKQYTGNFAIDEDILKSEGITDFDQYAIQPGAPLMPDFFLPGLDYNSLVNMDKERSKSRKAMKSSELDSLMAQIMKGISPSNVKSISAVYQFALKDNLETIHLFIDLKNDNGSVQRGKYSPGSDVQFEMELTDFVDMFHGKFSPTQAFMAKKLTIRGNMAKALQLEGVLKELVKSKI